MSTPFYINRDPKVNRLGSCMSEHSHPNLPEPRTHALITRWWVILALLCDQHISWFLFNDVRFFSDNHHRDRVLGETCEGTRTSSALILLHLFPCRSWSAPQDLLGTHKSPLLAPMIWAGSVHSSSCNSNIGSSKNNSQSRGQWWQTGSRGNRGKAK